jgi:hypothetical protein
VNLRLTEKAGDHIKAFADVELGFGAHGRITISGFSIIVKEGQALRVAPPARRGSSRYFDIVTLSGPIQQSVDRAVGEAYIRQQGFGA